MLGSLTRFELRYHMRQISFWAVLALMLVFSLGLTAFSETIGIAGERNLVNGTGFIVNSVASWDGISVFFAAIFTAGALLRDQTFKAVEVIHATPVPTREMILARIIGALVVVFLLISAGTLGTFLGQFAPNIAAESRGPIMPLAYLQPMLIFTLVNTVVVVAFFAVVASLTRSRMITLVSAVGFFALTLVAALLLNTDAPRLVQDLADPFGSVAFTNTTEFWSDADRNTRLAPLSGSLGLNRLVWLSIGLAGLAFAFAQFRRGVSDQARKGRRQDAVAAPQTPYRPVMPSTGFGADLAALRSQASLETVGVLRSIPFAILSGVFLVLFALIISVTLFFAPQKLVPTSAFMSAIGDASLVFPMALAIAFFTGELMWRDRTHGMTELVHAARVSDWPVVLGKWIAVFAMVAVLCLIPAVVGFFIQLFVDAPAPDLGTYLGYAVFSRMPGWLALAAFALFLQSFAPNRIVGMLLAFGGILGLTLGLGALPFSHPLMRFTGASPGSLSEMAGFSNWINFRWYNVYALGILSALGVLAVWLARRGVQGGVLQRLGRAPRRVSLPSTAVLGVSLAVALFAGVTIFRALDSVDYRMQFQRENRQVAWEELLGDYLRTPSPATTDVTLLADIYPSRREATVSGTFRVQNLTDEPMVDVFFDHAVTHDEDVRLFEIEGGRALTDGTAFDGALDVAAVRDFGVEIARFDPPLAPGESREVRFETFFHAPRLADGSVIRENGTFLNDTQATPSFGLTDRRMRNPDKRRKKGLDELEPMPARDDDFGRSTNFFGSTSRIMLDAEVCTSDDQIGIAPGRLVDTERADGRECRRYVTNAPISNFYSIVSGRYDVTEGMWTSEDGREVPIQVYHHPSHTYSVDAMITATQHGLTVFEREFTPYTLDYFRILEIPYIGFAQAFAGTIPFAEQGFILDTGSPDDASSIDNATGTTLHELAHQWFGHQLTPGLNQGFNVLSEGLTSYATLYAYEELYGFDKARTMLEKGAIEPYAALSSFGSEKEVPVAVSETQSYLHYQKPDWILWGLRGYIGADRVNAALRDLLVEYGEGRAPFATTEQVVAALKARAPDEYHQLIDDQWERITWWALGYGEEGPSVSETRDGRFRVVIPLTLDKTINHGEDGAQTSVTEIEGETLNEWVEVGFYGDTPKSSWGAWQALERARVDAETRVLEFIVDERPTHVALDPRRLLQERNVLDNVRKLPAAGGTGEAG